MKQLLVLSPYWVSANQVCTQRYRLICNHLEEFGWHPVVLSVDPKHYSMPLAPELELTVRKSVEVHYVNAALGKGCWLGKDVSWRGFLQLYREGLRLIREKPIDAIWDIIPSGFCPILARLLHEQTGVPYGIDYTDPWVKNVPPRFFSKSRISFMLAPILEKFAVKKAAFLAGVSELSYLSVLQRNPHLSGIPCDYFPLGFSPDDYQIRKEGWVPLWGEEKGLKPILYAGAFLPKSHFYIDILFETISELRSSYQWDKNIRFFFVGTGFSKPSITDYAVKHNINDIVCEIRERISYLSVLSHLANSWGTLVIGSTEAHYTASKIFQNLLCEKPIFAVFHKSSTVVEFLTQSHADHYLVKWSPDTQKKDFKLRMKQQFLSFINQNKRWTCDYNALTPYRAENITKQFVALINTCLYGYKNEH